MTSVIIAELNQVIEKQGGLRLGTICPERRGAPSGRRYYDAETREMLIELVLSDPIHRQSARTGVIV